MTVRTLGPVEVSEKPSTRAYAHYVLAVLCVANILNVADRGVMSLLLEPIKADLHASDTAMSLLTGAAFVVFYSLFGIPIALWSDRGNRRNILALGAAAWSIMTAACGLAVNFPQMALARAGVGIGEATGTPTSLSLIADYYARKMRPQVIAIFNLAIAFGAIAVTPLVGVVADSHGWRAAFVMLGIPGVLLALVVRFTVREPHRGGMDDHVGHHPVRVHTLAGSLRAMYGSRPFMLIIIGTSIVSMGSGTLGAWGPAMMMRAFHVSATQVAGISGPLIGIASVAGTMMGGILTAWLVKNRRSERWHVLAPALVSLITIPAGLIYVWAPSFGWMVFAGMMGAGTIAFRTSPYMALAIDLVPPNCRSMAAAATVIASSVVGQAGGPLVVGMISDALTPTMGAAEALRHGFLFAPFTLAIGVIPFFIALRDFDANGLKRAVG